MSYLNQQKLELLNRCLHDENLQKLYSALERSYNQATEEYELKGYPENLLKQDIGGIRRPIIQECLKAEFRFDKSVVVSSRDSKPKGHNHLELIFSDFCIVTVNYCTGIYGLPREAAHRKENAKHNPRIYQPPLPGFPVDEEKELENFKEGMLNVIITHGSHSGKTLDFAYVKVPHYDYRFSLHSDSIPQRIATLGVARQESVHPVPEIAKTDIRLRTKQLENPESDYKSGTGHATTEEGDIE